MQNKFYEETNEVKPIKVDEKSLLNPIKINRLLVFLFIKSNNNRKASQTKY